MLAPTVQWGCPFAVAGTGVAGSNRKSAWTPAISALWSMRDSVTPICTMLPGSPSAEPMTTRAAGGRGTGLRHGQRVGASRRVGRDLHRAGGEARAVGNRPQVVERQHEDAHTGAVDGRIAAERQETERGGVLVDRRIDGAVRTAVGESGDVRLAGEVDAVL